MYYLCKLCRKQIDPAHGGYPFGGLIYCSFGCIGKEKQDETKTEADQNEAQENADRVWPENSVQCRPAAHSPELGTPVHSSS